MVKSYLLYTHCLVIVKVKEMEKNIKCFFFIYIIFMFLVKSCYFCDCRICEVIYGRGHVGWIIVVVGFRFWIVIRIRFVGRISLWGREISWMLPMKLLQVWAVSVRMWRIWTSCTLWFLNWGKVSSVWIFVAAWFCMWKIWQ